MSGHRRGPQRPAQFSLVRTATRQGRRRCPCLARQPGREELGGKPAWTHLPGDAAVFRRVGPHLGPSRRQNEDAEEAGAGEVSRSRRGGRPRPARWVLAGEAGACRRMGCGNWWHQGSLPSSSAGCGCPPAPVSPTRDAFRAPRGWFCGLILLKVFYSGAPRGQLIPLSIPFPWAITPPAPQPARRTLRELCLVPRPGRVGDGAE